MLLSTLLLGAWWLCYRLALRHERSFAYNRWFLVVGPLLAAALPLLPLGWPAAWAPDLAAALPRAATVLPVVQAGAAGASPTAGLDWSWCLAVVYASGVAIMVLRVALELGRLWLRTRRLPRQPATDYVLSHTGGQLPTSSFGRVVFWDETMPLSPAEADQVLQHELAHVRQGHTYDRLLLEVLRAVLWFNPFVHLCHQALALTHEYLADEAALGAAAQATPAFSLARSYSHLLARQVASRLGFSIPLAHTFSQSQTLRRIAMIQKKSPIRRWKQWLALPLLGALLVTVACERSTETVAPSGTIPVNVSEANAQKTPNGFYDGDIPPPPPPALAAPDAPATTAVDVYTYAEQMPQMPGGGGAQAIVQYLQSHTKYTDDLATNPKEGIVFAKFTVTETGEVKDITIVKGLSRGYDHAVLDAIRTLPRFIPGRQDGKAVAVSFTVPVQFAKVPPVKGVGMQLFNELGMWAPKPTRGC